MLLGDGPTALSALRSLLGTGQVLGVMRTDQPDDPVRAYAAERGIDVWPFQNFRDLQSRIDILRPDAVVISSFGRVLPAAMVTSSLFINVHYSPLPRYRGRANVNWAVINDEPATAVSIHLVTPGLDDGNLLFQEYIVIRPTDTAATLYERLNAIQESTLGAAVLRALSGEIGWRQDEPQASYGCGRVPDDGEIDWRLSSACIDRLIRALSPPFPGAFTYLSGRRLVVVRAGPNPHPPRYDGRIPGRVIGRNAVEGWADVLTGDGLLRLFEVKLDSSEVLPAASVIASTRNTLGLSPLALLRRIEKLEKRLALLESVS